MEERVATPKEPTPLDRVARLARRLLGADAAVVARIHDAHMELLATVGLPEGFDGRRLPHGFGFCPEVARSRRVLVLPDTHADPGRRDHPVVRVLGVRAYAAVPLAGIDGTLAVLRHTPGGWTEEDIELLDDLAGLVDVELAAAARRERTERDLLERERFLATLFDAQPECVKVVAADFVILEMNRAGRRMLGERHVAGRSVFDWVAPESQATYRRAHEAALRGESPIFEFQTVVGDGGRRTFESHAAPLAGAGGEVRAVLSITRDVTEQRRTEEALREAEERFRLLARASNDALWELDPATNRLWWSECFADRFAYAPEEVGDHLDDWVVNIHPEDRPRVVRGAQDVLTGGGEVWEEQYRFRRGDGSWARVYDRGLVVRDADGRAVRFLGAMMDVTARVEDRERLAEREAQLRTILDLLPVGVVMADASGRILASNPAIDAIQGRHVRIPDDPEGYREFPARRVRDGRPIETHEWPLVRALATGEAVGAEEIEVQRRDGTWRSLVVHAMPVRDVDGRVTGAVVTAMDVTDRRRAEEALRHSEEQLRQAQKMEAIGRLAGGIAHDFNNILTAIQGHAQLLVEEAPPESRLRGDLGEILDAGARAAQLTRQLLAFSRKQVLQPKVLDLGSVLSELERMLRRLIGEHIELVTVIPESLGPVQADPGQVGQALLNLAVNARDAMPTGGRLTIVLEDAEVAGDPLVEDGRYVVVRVADTGCGIPPQVLPHVFEPFFTTKPTGQGTGLGLSTVYGIVKQSGGDVGVESRPGEGTTFVVYLPVSEGEPSGGAGVVHDPLAAGGVATLLVVEDEPSVRELLDRILRRADYRVLVARDGPTALEVASAHDGGIDLLITDVVMPGMSGPELAQRVLAGRPDTRVLYISGYTDDLLVHHGAAAGSSLLEKPFTPSSLLERVRELLS